MKFLEYGEYELSYLIKRDAKLGEIIKKVGVIRRATYEDPFDSLVGYIATQQISNKAAATVRSRIYQKFGVVTVDKLRSVSDEEIQSVGISMRKVQYIRNLIEAILLNKLEIEKIDTFPDEEIVSQLTSIKGIGDWTAEMFLIFTLKRMDVLSYKDLAIRRAITSLYGLNELDKKIFRKYQERYSPYGTVASLYLWHFSMDTN